MTQVANTLFSYPEPNGVGTLREVEFERALEIVAAHAVSDLGAAAVRARCPSTSREWVESELAAVQELVTLLMDGPGFTPLPVPDLAPTLRSLAADGSVLEPAALAELRRALEAIRRVEGDLRGLQEVAPRVAALAVPIPPQHLEQALQRALEEDGSVKDDASPVLRRARHRVREVRRKLVQLLERLAGQVSAQGATEAGAITVRGGRYVLSVRTDVRFRLAGIVHGESASGATLFVEPVEAVELGNDFARCQAEESRAVLAVLRQLTDEARTVADRIEGGWRMCIRADGLFARARYAMRTGGTPPRLIDAPGPLEIRRGVHPIILEEAKEPVPFQLALGSADRILLVSGPNAGGKTVLLKGVALISALTQAGIIPPVGAGTILPVFRRIFVDIGDHQSISESLSTFSARVAALKEILAQADPTSLVLLDEVGSGTDPFEGAALAGAVLLSLAERGSLTIATTHLSQLKDLAARSEGFVNASLRFDAETLTPSYQLQQGQPGRSYGLAIAQRLGMPSDILEAAERLLPEGARSLEAALADVEAAEAEVRRREQAVAEGEARLAVAQAAIGNEREELRQRGERVRACELALEREGREQARRFLLEARRRVENALALARAAVDEATAKESRRLVEEGVREEAEALKKLEGQGWKVSRDPRSGEKPRPPEGAGSAGSQSPWPTGLDRSLESLEAPSEVDLRGFTADEAEYAVRSAIDRAVVTDLPWVRIIHGKGTGALRARVAEVLKRDRRVKGFRLAPPEQGGSGVTVAELGS